MENQEFDIEIYIKNLPTIRKDVDTNLEELEKRFKKSSRILRMLIDREYERKGIIPNENELAPSSKLIENVRKLFFYLFKEFTRLKEFKEWYNSKKLDIKYILENGHEKEFYLPNDEDIKLIEYQKNEFLKSFKFDFKQVLGLTPIELKNSIIDKKIKDLVCHYHTNYSSGEMIEKSGINGSMQLITIANDWAKCDFIQYLKNEKSEESFSIEKNDYDWSLPKRLQMLNEIGFFKLEIFSKLKSDLKQAELVNIILGKESNNTRKYLRVINGAKSNMVSNPLEHKELCKSKIKELVIGQRKG